jgi:hypothetical protein
MYWLKLPCHSHKDLQLSKKSARWVIKLRNEEMKKARLRMCEAIITTIATAFRPFWTILPLLVSRLGVKSNLVGLAFTQEASLKELQGVVRN